MSTNLNYISHHKESWIKSILIFLFTFLLCSTSVNAATYEEGKQAYLRKDYARALEILRPLAESGDSQAQITMALMYDYGHGVEKNPSQSIKWYRMAAEQGIPIVQHDLGVKYFQGQGVEQDYREAAKWWELSANAGVADSQFNLGLMHYRGIGIPKDYEKAAKLFEDAAEQGHGNAQYSLAVMYAFGQSKVKNYETAIKWFKKSAEQNIAQAQFNLGVFNENGYGVEKDHEKAKEWYQLAAAQGLQEAIEKLKSLNDRKSDVEKNQDGSSVDMSDVPTATVTAPDTSTMTSSDSVLDSLNRSNWLKQQDTDKYTLQLASVINEKDVIKYLKQTGLDSKAGYIVVIVNNITRYTAIYGLYDTYKSAEIAVTELPPAIQRAKPWIRNTGILQGIQQ